MKTKKRFLTYVILGLAVSCVTLQVNIHFPEAEIEKAAEIIETEVRGGAPVEEGMPSSMRMQRPGWRLALGFGQTAHAQERRIDLHIDTPEIRTIVDRRKKRWNDVRPLLSNGFVGEALDGTLKEKDATVLGLRELAEARRVVKAENDDRQALYRELAKANDIPSSEVRRIAELFAEENRKQLSAGQHFEERQKDESVIWVKK